MFGDRFLRPQQLYAILVHEFGDALHSHLQPIFLGTLDNCAHVRLSLQKLSDILKLALKPGRPEDFKEPRWSRSPVPKDVGEALGQGDERFGSYVHHYFSPLNA
jgi:hypothetical protein